MSEAEHLERLRGDVETLLTVQLSGFDDDAWGPLAEALAEYGYAVMRGWLASGKIFTELAKRSRGVKRPPDDDWLNDTEIRSLAGEVVAVALGAFKRVLQEGRWNAAKGASLATYFVGQCLLQFGNVYRAWYATEEDFHQFDAAQFDPESTASSHDPARLVASDERRGRLLGQMEPRTARVMALVAEGYSYAEIVERLDDVKDVKAVENLVTRERKKWQTDKRSLES